MRVTPFIFSLLKPLIATLEHNQIVKVMGKLSSTDCAGLDNAIQAIPK